MVANEFNKPLFILFHFNYYATMEGLPPLFNQECEDIVIFPHLRGFKITLNKFFLNIFEIS